MGFVDDNLPNDSKAEVVVAGLGRSGQAAAKLLLAEGHSVIVVDEADGEDLQETAADLRQKGASVFLGVEGLQTDDPDLVVLSPGIGPQSPFLLEALEKGHPVIPELELGWSRIASRVIAVTGSNGKSTAVKWLGDILAMNGKKTIVGGNYGRPASEIALEESSRDWVVLEVSSFQLERIVDFRADIAVLLNILPDHLDRHPSLEAYRSAKLRIFENCGADDVCIIPDELVKQNWFPESLESIACNRVTFGRSPGADWRVENGRAHSPANGRSGEEGVTIDLRGTYFESALWADTVGAVSAAAFACGIEAEEVQRAAQLFEPLPHRLQRVAEIEGVSFINDSKATNLAAMQAAVESMQGPVRLIAGGRPKENDFEKVNSSVSKVRSVYLIGEAASEMREAWRDLVPCILCGGLERALERAWTDASEGETVLLSPGCASFDQFSGFAERGERFIKFIKGLVRRNTIWDKVM